MGLCIMYINYPVHTTYIVKCEITLTLDEGILQVFISIGELRLSIIAIVCKKNTEKGWGKTLVHRYQYHQLLENK